MDAAKQELMALGRLFHARGWSLATSGNYSVRVDTRNFLITASGKDKGSLTASDLILVDVEGIAAKGSGSKPSAETLVHAALYRRNAAMGAVIHIHSVYSTILSVNHAAEGQLVIQGYEMLKALEGVNTHEHKEVLPVFSNTQDMKKLATAVEQSLPGAAHGFLVAGHGLYTWGETLTIARRHVEAFEFLMECEYRRIKRE